MGGSIPKTLPNSTLACPPSSSYVRQFQPNSTNTPQQTGRLVETAPQSIRGSTERKPDLIATERQARPQSGSRPGTHRRDPVSAKTDRPR